MSFDRSLFERKMKERLEEKVRAREPQVRQIVQAATAMEVLTGDERWDYYLSVLQGRCESLFAELERWDGIMQGTAMVTADELAHARTQRVATAAAIEALEWAIGQPKAIMEEAVQAKEGLPQ